MQPKVLNTGGTRDLCLLRHSVKLSSFFLPSFAWVGMLGRGAGCGRLGVASLSWAAALDRDGYVEKELVRHS